LEYEKNLSYQHTYMKIYLIVMVLTSERYTSFDRRA